MDKLITKIDELMTSIQQDTSRADLPALCLVLVELSKLHWAAKQDLIRTKSKYDREFVMKKEQRKQELERLENEKASKDDKYKKGKITNVEVENYVELELLSLKKEQEEPQMKVAYLDVYVRSIYEWILSIKFISKANQAFIKFDDQQPPF